MVGVDISHPRVWFCQRGDFSLSISSLRSTSAWDRPLSLISLMTMDEAAYLLLYENIRKSKEGSSPSDCHPLEEVGDWQKEVFERWHGRKGKRQRIKDKNEDKCKPIREARSTGKRVGHAVEVAAEPCFPSRVIFQPITPKYCRSGERSGRYEICCDELFKYSHKKMGGK